MNCYIYKLTAPNGKIYIGQTTRLKPRLNRYKNCSCQSQPKLYNAIRKYKWENFSVEILIKTDTIFSDFYERRCIIYFNTIQEGLNCESGGNTQKVLSEETKEKIRVAKMGQKHSEATKLLISKRTIGKKHNKKTNNVIPVLPTSSRKYKRKLTLQQKLYWDKLLNKC